MLWAHVRTNGAFRALSTLLSMMLVLMLSGPGLAAFAIESTSTPTPVAVEVPVPVVPAPVEVPEQVPGDAEVPEDGPDATDEGSEPGEIDESVDPEEMTEQDDPPGSPEPSVEAIAPTVTGALVLANGARSDFPAPVTVGEGCELQTIATFWAGQHIDVGTVTASHDADNVYVTFATTGGWTMGLTHLYVGLTPPASYAPGSFPYQTNHNPAVTSHTYTISLASLSAQAGDTIYIAAHAEVSNGQGGETAWAGQGQWPGLLFSHTLEECEEPIPADITVIKFNDLDEDGVLDEGEPFVEGVTITLAGESVESSASTDADGEVVFEDLYEGTYSIDEILPAGWFATVDLPIEVELVEGQDQTVYIGNAEEPDPEPIPADITVIKFNDLDEDGVLDEGEPFVEGVTITLAGESVESSASTDADGEVVFEDLYEGTYSIDEILPAGWFATVDLPIEVELVEGQDQTVYIGNAEESLPFTDIDLAIEKQADVERAAAGDIITYTLTYRNLGTTDATDFVIVDDFDETLVQVVNAGGGMVVGGTIVWNLTGPLGPEDGPQTLVYTVLVLELPQAGADIYNLVTIDHPADTNEENNSDDETVAGEGFLPFTPDPAEPEDPAAPEPFLPFTGGESWTLLALGLAAITAGTILRRAGSAL